MFIEETKKTPVTDTCDVFVCGGGFAGIAAALAAAREKKKVILADRGFLLGGLGTAGLITGFLALCDGLGHQVSFGIPEELLRLCVQMGQERNFSNNWLFGQGTRTKTDPRFEGWFNPSLAAILMEQRLLKEGVQILYGTLVCDVHKAGNKIDAVIIENKSGRSAIQVKSVVDATGDADLVHLTNTPEAVYTGKNVLAAWYYAYDSEKGYVLNPMGCCDVPVDAANPNAPELSKRRFVGLDAKEISEFNALAHEAILKDVNKKREQKADPEGYFPITVPTIPDLRMTRRLVGEYTLDDAEQFKHFDDSVGMVSDWRKRGPVYEVPFRTLYSKACKNLICAGRCTCVTDKMWDIMRVIPDCTVTGQAAGTAAALSDDFAQLDISLLQRALESKGAKLHLDQVGL